MYPKEKRFKSFFANDNDNLLNSELLMHSFLAMTEGVPTTYKEAMNSPEKDKWIAAMKCEMNSFHENKVYTLVAKPQNLKPIATKWVFRIKYNHLGQISKYKARLVAKGFTQIYGRDFYETYAPVVKFKSFRTLMCLAVNHGLTLWQDDVPTAFLKGDLKEDIWIKLPDGLVVKLNKTLYGLKQSPMEWNNTLNEFLTNYGLKRCEADKCIYYNNNFEKPLYVAVYVDDIITAGIDTEDFRKRLHKEFKMDESSPLEWYLGIKISCSPGKITMDQNQYIDNKIKEFEKYIGQDCSSLPLPVNYQQLLEADSNEPASTDFPYRQMVGSLMYAMLGTRPDLAFSMSIVSRHLSKPTKLHCKFVIQIFKYLRKNLYELTYTKSDNILKAYVDASYGNQIDYKSTSGYLIFLGKNLITWISNKQNCYVFSAAESEYVAISSLVKELLWESKLLTDLNFSQSAIEIFEDNMATIAMACNPQENHKRTKHIQIAFHSTRDYVKNKFIKITHVPTNQQLADFMTKAISGIKLRIILNNIGLISSKSGGELDLLTSLKSSSSSGDITEMTSNDVITV